MTRSEPGGGLRSDSTAPVKAWVPEEMLSLRTSGRGQSDRIKPKVGG